MFGDWDKRCNIMWKLDPKNEHHLTDRVSVEDIPEPIALFLVAVWNSATLGRYYVWCP
jgi:hypothetical protein